MTLSLPQILQALTQFESQPTRLEPIKVGISASITLELLGVFLRKHAMEADLRLQILMGNYQDPLGDIERLAQADWLILWPFFDKLMPGFELRLASLDPAQVEAKASEFEQLYRLVLAQTAAFKRVFLAKFHRFSRPAWSQTADPVVATLERFNQILERLAQEHPQVALLDLEQVVAQVGRQAAFDPRFYYRAQAPYALPFLDEVARRLFHLSRAFAQTYPKVLVLDCDNTLWGGVVGEESIQLNAHEFPGSLYWQMQHLFLALEKQGVLLCLCSKNNPEDVLAILDSHPDCLIRRQHLAALRLNWGDKVSNLRELAQELNLGLESMVFLDDSDFECQAVRSQLPEVTTLQVPKNLSAYPEIGAQLQELFLAVASSGQGSRSALYQIRQQALQSRPAFASQQEYLASLQMRVKIECNQPEQLPRIAELSQKTNQFNLTSLRYTLQELQQKVADQEHDLFALSVSDRFGDSGLTGVLIVHYQPPLARVEAFFLSCRVLGRGVEDALWPTVARAALARGCDSLQATYRATAKNAQVKDYYTRLGLVCLEEDQTTRHYAIALAELTPPHTPWIEVHHG